MIFATNNYDVDAPEGGKPTTQFITIKDWKVIAVVVVILFFVSVPIYKQFKSQRDEQLCKSNMNGIYKAMMQYSIQNDERFPPLYSIGANGAPLLFDNKPIVWASVVSPYMNKRDSFDCPSIEEGEGMATIGSENVDINLAYGMYVAMGSEPYLLLSQPNSTALLLETSNNGAQGSYNPLPFRDTTGSVVPFDAFMAGYDDSNKELTRKSKWITRLAYRNAKNGYDKPGVVPRHAKGLHIIYADGHLGSLHAPEAEVENLWPDAEGTWRVR